MNTDSPLSQQWSQVPPPLSKLEGLRLNHEDLCAFLLKEPSQEPTFDVWARSVKYRQRVHLTDLNHMLSVAPTDLAFYIGLEALHQQWNNPDLMTIPIWAELAQTNKLSDAKKTHILRANKLQRLIDHFKTLPRDKELFKKILAKYARIAKLPEKKLNILKNQEKGQGH